MGGRTEHFLVIFNNLSNVAVVAWRTNIWFELQNDKYHVVIHRNQSEGT